MKAMLIAARTISVFVSQVVTKWFPQVHLLILQIDCRVKEQACQVLFSSFMGELFQFNPVNSPVVEGRKSQNILHSLSIRRNLFYVVASGL